MFKDHDFLSAIIQLRPRRDVFTFNRKAGWWIPYHLWVGSDDQSGLL